MRIILARHGETDYNKNKLVQGHTDIPLNEEGISQGIAAGKKIEGYTIDVAYSSTLGRAFDTARYMLDNSNSEENKNLSVIKDKRLIEKSYGEYEGVSFAEYGAGLKAGETRGMELDSDAADRVEAFFKEKHEEHPDKTILAVCHGGLIRSFLTQKGIKEVGRGVIVNTSVSVLDYDGERFELIEFTEEGFKAVLTQAPYRVSAMKEGDEGEYTVNDVTDWIIYTDEMSIDPNTAYLL